MAERTQFTAAARRPAPLVAQTDQLQLPSPQTALVGRADAIEAVVGLLQQSTVRLVTLTGPAGVGKTRLALAVAERLAHRLADGVIFVSLVAVATPDLVLGAIATVLSVRERAGQTLQQRLIQSLQVRQALIVLDNFEHLLSAAPLLSDLMAACPQLLLLATSRAPLRLGGEHQFAVQPLEVPAAWQEIPLEHLLDVPAVALFQQRAHAVAPFAVTVVNGETILAICRRLDGLPLAIELAAVRTKLLSPQALLERLDNRLELLTRGAYDLPMRQQTLKGALAWSYDLLAPDEQLLFAQLGVFVDGCTLAAAEAVCAPLIDKQSCVSAAPFAVLDGLEALLDNSLLQHCRGADGETRFIMLETIREYALEQLTLRFDRDTQRRHADYYMTLAEQAEAELTGAQQEITLAQLEIEHANLRAALAWACTHGAAQIGLRLAGALWRFWYMCGHLSEGRHWLHATLVLPTAAGDDLRALHGKVLFGASGLAWGQGDLVEATELGERSLLLQRQIGDNVGAALVLNVLANVAKDRGDHAQASEYLEEGLQLQRAAGNQFGIAIALMNLGVLARDQGEYPRAQALYEESLALYRALGNTSGIAIALNNLGDALLTAGDYPRAAALFEESAALARAINNPHGVALALDNLEIAVRYNGDYARATTLAQESLAIRQRLGDKESLVTSLVNLGEIALEQGDNGQAQIWFDQSLALAHEVGKLEWIALTQRNLGLVALNVGAHTTAAEHLGASLRLYQEGGMMVGVAEALEGCAALALAQEHTRDAVQLLSTAAALRERHGARPTPPERRLYEQTSAAARAQLGEAAFAMA